MAYSPIRFFNETIEENIRTKSEDFSTHKVKLLVTSMSNSKISSVSTNRRCLTVSNFIQIAISSKVGHENIKHFHVYF